ncbi:nucleotide exchange factor GrpE [Nostoc sp. CCY0012]|uniref:nucleotide exchange factor GrpE n=1 Tax=Nostoc sp. CCY0012 TaxID=1056123 RepID=UPI0039C5F3CC
MTKEPEIFKLSQEQRDKLLQEVSYLLKEKFLLKQALREQQQLTSEAKEELFLDLLELLDALEFLQNYVTEHIESVPTSWASLAKSLASIEKKFLALLSRRQVKPIDFQDSQPDFNLCKVVDIEIRNDLENQTVTKIVRRGFRINDKLLRSVEVITSKTQK